MTNSNFVFLNSRLYSRLFEIGGDNLIAIYSLLKFGKNGAIKFYKEPKKNIYRTLKEKTTVSIPTLKKYIPLLEQEGLVHFDGAGNFVLLGNSKINDKYKKGKTKYVPIEVSSYKETKLYSFRVRLFKMEKQQKKRIDRRDELNNIIEKTKKKQFLSKRQYNLHKNMSNLDKEYADSFNETFSANTVLSNQGFSKLKAGVERSKGSGFYWKNKLVSAGIIKTKRNFKFIRNYSKEDFAAIKYRDRSYKYSNGKLYKETCARFTTTEFEEDKKLKMKPLAHLSFDFIAFCINQD